jgi:putative endonuclease
VLVAELVVGRRETSDGLRGIRGAVHGQALGRAGEAAAEGYLQQLGYTVIARNYRCYRGEVDLVAIDDTTLVFVEVKTRSGKTCGSPLEAVDVRKQRRLAAAAQHFLVTQRCCDRFARFDVIGVLWRGGVPEIEHVPNAFEVG